LSFLRCQPPGQTGLDTWHTHLVNGRDDATRCKRSNSRARSCSPREVGRGLPDCTADEERAETIEIERGLLSLAHCLDDRRQRKELFADESDDEVVVVAIEPVTGQTDVVNEIRRAKRDPERAMFGEDLPLLVFRKTREAAAPPQGVPDCPAPGWIEY